MAVLGVLGGAFSGGFCFGVLLVIGVNYYFSSATIKIPLF
jgi:hypothetical protein